MTASCHAALERAAQSRHFSYVNSKRTYMLLTTNQEDGVSNLCEAHTELRHCHQEEIFDIERALN
jgi:hypothetical protein